eukprot:8622977-Ditylum_brightwellii.AAC.1
MLTWGAQTYVKRMLASYGQLFGEPVLKQEVYEPLKPADSPLFGMEDIKKYWQMIGEVQWAVALGCIDIIAATMTMTRFRSAPCQEMPDYSNYKVEKKNWGCIYHLCQEEILDDMHEPSGKPTMATTFVDANLLH